MILVFESIVGFTNDGVVRSLRSAGLAAPSPFHVDVRRIRRRHRRLRSSSVCSGPVMANQLNRIRLLENVFNRVTEFARTVHSILPTIRECVELHQRLLESISRILSLLRLIRDGLVVDRRTNRLTSGRAKGWRPGGRVWSRRAVRSPAAVRCLRSTRATLPSRSGTGFRTKFKPVLSRDRLEPFWFYRFQFWIFYIIFGYRHRNWYKCSGHLFLPVSLWKPKFEKKFRQVWLTRFVPRKFRDKFSLKTGCFWFSPLKSHKEDFRSFNVFCSFSFKSKCFRFQIFWRFLFPFFLFRFQTSRLQFLLAL